MFPYERANETLLLDTFIETAERLVIGFEVALVIWFQRLATYNGENFFAGGTEGTFGWHDELLSSVMGLKE